MSEFNQHVLNTLKQNSGNRLTPELIAGIYSSIVEAVKRMEEADKE